MSHGIQKYKCCLGLTIKECANIPSRHCTGLALDHGTHGPQWVADEIGKAEKMTDKTNDGYEIVPPLPDPARKGVKCGKCGMKFDDGKAYGFACPRPRCPIQMRIT